MDAQNLLKSWPMWSKAGAETILASPAWRLPVRYGEKQGVMTIVPSAEVSADCLAAEAIRLEATLDGEPFTLALADTPLYPDLHLLWSKRSDLPPEIVLALVEKECGGVLEMLEKILRRQLGLKGLADSSATTSSVARVFRVTLPDGTLDLSLSLPPEVLPQLARLENLDTGHASIRELTRPAYLDYTVLMLTEEERQALAPGSCILLPENFPATQAWAVEPPEEGSIHLVSRATTDISFAAFADDSLPPVPPPESLVLSLGADSRFPCELTRVGDAPAIRIMES